MVKRVRAVRPLKATTLTNTRNQRPREEARAVQPTKATALGGKINRDSNNKEVHAVQPLKATAITKTTKISRNK